MRGLYSILIVLALVAQTICAAVVIKRSANSASLTTLLSEEIHEEDGEVLPAAECPEQAFGTIAPKFRSFALPLPVLHALEGPGDPPESLA